MMVKSLKKYTAVIVASYSEEVTTEASTPVEARLNFEAGDYESEGKDFDSWDINNIQESID